MTKKCGNGFLSNIEKLHEIIYFGCSWNQNWTTKEMGSFLKFDHAWTKWTPSSPIGWVQKLVFPIFLFLYPASSRLDYSPRFTIIFSVFLWGPNQNLWIIFRFGSITETIGKIEYARNWDVIYYMFLLRVLLPEMCKFGADHNIIE